MENNESQLQLTPQQLHNSIDKCVHHLRFLKSTVLGAHNAISEKFNNSTEDLDAGLEKLKEYLERCARQIAEEYDKMETEAKQLPAQTPASLMQMVNKLNHFLLDCATNVDMNKTYVNTQDVFDWSDNTASFINYTYEFFKLANTNYLTQQRSRKLTLAHQWTMQNEPNDIPSEPSSHQLQRNFEQLLANYVHKQTLLKHTVESFNYRLVLNYLEQSAFSSLIEVKFISIISNNYKTSDGQPVCLLKCLLLVNGGSIDYVHMVAPHEEWSYTKMSGFGNKKQVDLSVSSRYDLYQKCTAHGNAIANWITPVNFRMLNTFFQYLSRLYTIDQQCSRCGKRLRDFAPVLCSDQNLKIIIHLSCK